jgi:hypothetical protein
VKNRILNGALLFVAVASFSLEGASAKAIMKKEHVCDKIMAKETEVEGRRNRVRKAVHAIGNNRYRRPFGVFIGTSVLVGVGARNAGASVGYAAGVGLVAGGVLTYGLDRCAGFGARYWSTNNEFRATRANKKNCEELQEHLTGVDIADCAGDCKGAKMSVFVPVNYERDQRMAVDRIGCSIWNMFGNQQDN